MIGVLLTDSESVLGWFSMPMTVGTIVGAIVGGKKIGKIYAGRETRLFRIGFLINMTGAAVGTAIEHNIILGSYGYLFLVDLTADPRLRYLRLEHVG